MLAVRNRIKVTSVSFHAEGFFRLFSTRLHDCRNIFAFFAKLSGRTDSCRYCGKCLKIALTEFRCYPLLGIISDKSEKISGLSLDSTKTKELINNDTLSSIRIYHSKFCLTQTLLKR